MKIEYTTTEVLNEARFSGIIQNQEKRFKAFCKNNKLAYDTKNRIIRDLQRYYDVVDVKRGVKGSPSVWTIDGLKETPIPKNNQTGKHDRMDPVKKLAFYGWLSEFDRNKAYTLKMMMYEAGFVKHHLNNKLKKKLIELVRINRLSLIISDMEFSRSLKDGSRWTLTEDDVITDIVQDFCNKLNRKLSDQARSLVTNFTESGLIDYEIEYRQILKNGYCQNIKEERYNEFKRALKGVYPDWMRQAKCNELFGVDGMFEAYRIFPHQHVELECEDQDVFQAMTSVSSKLYFEFIENAERREQEHYKQKIPIRAYHDVDIDYLTATMTFDDDIADLIEMGFINPEQVCRDTDTVITALKRTKEYVSVFRLLADYVFFGEENLLSFQ